MLTFYIRRSARDAHRYAELQSGLTWLWRLQVVSRSDMSERRTTSLIPVYLHFCLAPMKSMKMSFGSGASTACARRLLKPRTRTGISSPNATVPPTLALRVLYSTGPMGERFSCHKLDWASAACAAVNHGLQGTFQWRLRSSMAKPVLDTSVELFSSYSESMSGVVNFSRAVDACYHTGSVMLFGQGMK